MPPALIGESGEDPRPSSAIPRLPPGSGLRRPWRPNTGTADDFHQSAGRFRSRSPSSLFALKSRLSPGCPALVPSTGMRFPDPSLKLVPDQVPTSVSLPASRYPPDVKLFVLRAPALRMTRALCGSDTARESVSLLHAGIMRQRSENVKRRALTLND